MARARHGSGAGTKSGRFRKRNPNCTDGNQISALMTAIKGLLPLHKSAWELHILTGAGLSTCQKMLSGHRAENLDVVLALLRSAHGLDLLKAIMMETDQPWFDELLDLADIARCKRDQLRVQRDLERREKRLLEARAQR